VGIVTPLPLAPALFAASLGGLLGWRRQRRAQTPAWAKTIRSGGIDAAGFFTSLIATWLAALPH